VGHRRPCTSGTTVATTLFEFIAIEITSMNSKRFHALFSCAALQKAGVKMACLLVISAGLSSCASTNQRQAALAKKAEAQKPQLYDWHGDTASGPATVNIVLNEQKAYIYRGGQPAGWTYVATGKSGHNTPTGSFTVMEKKPHKVSETYGVIKNSAGQVIDWDAEAGRDPVPRGGRFVGAPMPYWMRITGGGIGMHAGIIPNPGLPASHGCIRLPAPMAARLYEVVEPGSKVVITHDAPASSAQITAGAQ
jgi:lipoprotein-anchoring transpeptidase ErfK/SrfK